MCQQLRQLRQAVQAFAAGFDAAGLTPEQARTQLADVARIKASVSALEALLAARSAESGTWKEAGFRSAADRLAREMGTTPGVARDVLGTGRRLFAQPEVARSALHGDLSAQQAALVASGAEAAPGRRRDLVRQAREGSLSELQDEVARARAVAVDAEARRRAIRARRSLRSWTDAEGVWQARMAGNPEDGARVRWVLDTIRRRLVALGQERGERDSFEALAFDSLIVLARVAEGGNGALSFAELQELGLFPGAAGTPGPPAPAGAAGSPAPAGAAGPPAPAGTAGAAAPAPTGGAAKDAAQPPRKSPRRSGAKVELQVRVDLDTLLRGVPLEGELCEIVGYGPVAVSTIDDLVANDDVFLAAVLTRGQEIVGVKRFGRAPTADQRSALSFLYPTCAVKGCGAKVGLQSDHREDWARTHYTVFDLMDRLCAHHHGMKTRNGWALVAGRGKRDFVPPGDPRHPRSRQSSRPDKPGRPRRLEASPAP